MNAINLDSVLAATTEETNTTETVGTKPVHYKFLIEDHHSLRSATVIDGSKPTKQEWLEGSGLDFEVMESELLYDFQGATVNDPERKVIYNSKNGEVFGVFKKGYKPIQNGQLVDFFQNTLEEYDAELMQLGYANNGAQVFAVGRLGNSSILDEDYQRNVLLIDSRDGSKSVTTMFSNVRLACFNQLPMLLRVNGQRGTVGRGKHTQNLDLANMAIDIGLIHASYEEQDEKLEKLAKCQMSGNDALKVLYHLNKKKDNIEDESTRNLNLVLAQYEKFNGAGIALDTQVTKNTAYGLLNAITEQYTHEYGNNDNTRFLANANGVAAKKKTEAFNFLDDLVNGRTDLPDYKVEHILEKAYS